MRIGILGAGGWGTALAVIWSKHGREVTLWARRPGFAERLRLTRRNDDYLPGVELPASIEVTGEMRRAVEGREAVVVAAPSHAVRRVARSLAANLDGQAPVVVSAAKGLEEETLLRMSEVLSEELSRAGVQKLAVLSGPNFSREVARGLPTATVVSSYCSDTMAWLQELLSTPSFRIYTNPDVIGVEIGGALKNVLALGVGIADGLGVGHNARAALITRGLAEITRTGVALGASAATFWGLSGVGDLVLTCTGEYSRNRRAGYQIGCGVPVSEVLGSSGMVIEGIRTARSAYQLSRVLGVDMPITEQIYKVLYCNLDPGAAVAALMSRPQRAEAEGMYNLPSEEEFGFTG